MDEKIVGTLFKKREENIFISKEEQKEILGEEIIQINKVIELINDDNIVSQLLKCEEQYNAITAEYFEIFYKQRFL